MIKKQVDWVVKVQPFSDGGTPPEVTQAALKQLYPQGLGWELLSTEVAQVATGTIMIMFTFARYEYIGESSIGATVAPEPVAEEVRRGPGRPKRVEVAA